MKKWKVSFLAVALTIIAAISISASASSRQPSFCKVMDVSKIPQGVGYDSAGQKFNKASNGQKYITIDSETYQYVKMATNGIANVKTVKKDNKPLICFDFSNPDPGGTWLEVNYNLLTLSTDYAASAPAIPDTVSLYVDTTQYTIDNNDVFFQYVICEVGHDMHGNVIGVVNDETQEVYPLFTFLTLGREQLYSLYDENGNVVVDGLSSNGNGTISIPYDNFPHGFKGYVTFSTSGLKQIYQEFNPSGQYSEIAKFNGSNIVNIEIGCGAYKSNVYQKMYFGDLIFGYGGYIPGKAAEEIKLKAADSFAGNTSHETSNGSVEDKNVQTHPDDTIKPIGEAEVVVPPADVTPPAENITGDNTQGDQTVNTVANTDNNTAKKDHSVENTDENSLDGEEQSSMIGDESETSNYKSIKDNESENAELATEGKQQKSKTKYIVIPCVIIIILLGVGVAAFIIARKNKMQKLQQSNDSEITEETNDALKFDETSENDKSEDKQ